MKRKLLYALAGCMTLNNIYAQYVGQYQPGQAQRNKEHRKAYEQYQEVARHIGYIDEFGVRIPVYEKDFFYKANPKEFTATQVMLYHRLRLLLEDIAHRSNPETSSYIIELVYDNMLNVLYKRDLFEPVDYVKSYYGEFIKELGSVHSSVSLVPIVEVLKSEWAKRLAFKSKKH